MNSLSNFSANFNSKFSFTGGSLTNHGGLLIFNELFKKIQLNNIIAKHFVSNDRRKFYRFSNPQLLMQLLLQKLAGYDTDYACKELKDDAYFPKLFENELVASQPTLSRFFERGTQETVESLKKINMEIVQLFLQYTPYSTLLFDIDSTYFSTNGHQEGTAYNAHYRTTGYHPLLAFESQTGYCLNAALRPGNLSCSDGADDFILPLLNQFDAAVYRMDSGFASPKIYELIEKIGQLYVIKLRDNQVLQRLGDPSLPSPFEEEVTILPRTIFSENRYQAKSWKHDRRVCQLSNKKEGELLYDTVSLVTNFTRGTSEEIFNFYSQRGNAENFIKETKSGFFGDKTDSSTMVKNEIRMLISCIAYNIYVFLKHLMEKVTGNMTIQRFRRLFVNIAGRLVKHAGAIELKLSSIYRYQTTFTEIYRQVLVLNLNLPVPYRPNQRKKRLPL